MPPSSSQQPAQYGRFEKTLEIDDQIEPFPVLLQEGTQICELLEKGAGFDIENCNMIQAVEIFQKLCTRGFRKPGQGSRGETFSEQGKSGKGMKDIPQR
jgi:hypothetical protein